MSGGERFPVVLLWHMHQPNYRDALSGQYLLPWTYLHAIKDYVDMAAHLEANPDARAVVNFTPVLIEQLQELAERTAQHLQSGTPLPDAVLALISSQPVPTDPLRRAQLINACLRGNRPHLIERYPAFAALAELALTLGKPEAAAYASDQFMRDLAVWYHVAWLGETVKRGDARVAALIEHAHDFTPAHCRALLELIGGLLQDILPRYRRLGESGRVELAVSPYSHPILPLLLDFRAARDSHPEAALPQASGYPGGAARAQWHMQEAVTLFERVFGRRPIGCWPSEGAISGGALDLIEAAGFQWAATSANVLRGCLAASYPERAPFSGEHAVNQPYRRAGHRLQCFFRHDELSDMIGFKYSTWHGDDAVANFIYELERVVDDTRRVNTDGAARVVLVAMDGENAWEYFPYNAYYFLNGLYAALAKHPRLRMTTLGEFVASTSPAAVLPKISAGSWVHGTLATWMGHRDKNRGWDLLVAAKRDVDAALTTGRFDAARRAQIERQLAQCESSDWFWWFGDYNPAEAVRDFDNLFRHQLASLYHLIDVPLPDTLLEPVSVGHGSPESGGVMRRANE